MGTWATAEIIRFWWQLGSSYVRVRVGLRLWIRLGGVRTTLGFLRPWPGHIRRHLDWVCLSGIYLTVTVLQTFAGSAALADRGMRSTECHFSSCNFSFNDFILREMSVYAAVRQDLCWCC